MHVPKQLSTVPASQPIHDQIQVLGAFPPHLPSLPLRVLSETGTRTLTTLWLVCASHIRRYVISATQVIDGGAVYNTAEMSFFEDATFRGNQAAVSPPRPLYIALIRGGCVRMVSVKQPLSSIASSGGWTAPDLR